MSFPNLSLASSPVRRIGFALTLLLVASPVLANWPTIDQISTNACQEGESFTIDGQHFGDDLLNLVVVIRETGVNVGATTTLTHLENFPAQPTAPATDILDVELDPVGRHFIGDLELHVAELFPISNGVLIQGPREYLLSDQSWVESVCYVPGGQFTVNPPPKTALIAESAAPAVPPYLLMRDPSSTAMNSTVILASDPPPNCSTIDLSLPVNPLQNSGFFARITVTQVEGPLPTPTEWRADLAMAIQQTFGAYGVSASPHPDGVAVSFQGVLTDGFAVFYPDGLEP